MLRRRANTPGSGSTTADCVPFHLCPAKTFLCEDGRRVPGRSVPEHCRIVGEVARELIKRLPEKIAESLFPAGSALIAASHDIGKVSPTFFEKLRRACSPAPEMPVLRSVDPDLEKSWGGHAGVSQVAARQMQLPRYIPEIIGQHHGFSPPVDGKRAEDPVFGGRPWQQQREALVAELKQQLGEDWPELLGVAQARVLAGLTSVADWIGSGECFEDPSRPWQSGIAEAVDKAGLIPPAYQTGLAFDEIFGFPPRPVQQALIDSVTGPGVYVLEAPMGGGKTEAALYAAYRQLAKGDACGIYFALPTQLTSNRIFERFTEFLRGNPDKGLPGILADDCNHRSLLLHSNAWLVDTDMGEEGQPGGAWFSQAKRGLLAPFAVGTLDQALMAAMNVRHGFVRAFGLAGKVVILDEVHTYDAFTSTLLDALVALLRELQCTVIILSATLNQERRAQLLDSNAPGTAYPLITAVPAGHAPIPVAVSADGSQEVSIHTCSDDAGVVEEVLTRAGQGQQVLWIENTVREAQQRYLDLAARAAELGVACGLLHSRFTPEDRQRREAEWVSLFGKAGWSRRVRQGHILVGTQVLEQSLDIDADFMVSRFAPTDMLLQRLGRLWRHRDTPRPESARRECWLLLPPLEQAINNPPKAFGPSAFVYSPYVLCRSLEVWQGRTRVCLPDDIRSLIAQTYASRAEQGPMALLLRELDEGNRYRKGRRALAQLARITLAENGKTLPESKAETRYSEVATVDLLLLADLTYQPEQKETCLTLLNGEPCRLPGYRHRLGRPQWRELSATLMRQVVSVPIQDAPAPLPLSLLRKLGFQHCFYLGDPSQDEALLRVALVDECGELHGLEGYPLHDHRLEYREDLGYRGVTS